MDGRALTQPRQQHSTQLQDTERNVAGVIARLLLHYYSPGDLSEAARHAMAQDWVEDLVEFGAPAVSQACGEWRRTQTRRPVPAEIRKLCVEAGARQQVRSQASEPADMEGYARSVGWASEAERRAAISIDERQRQLQYDRARLAREEAKTQSGMSRHVASASATALGVKAREYTPAELRTGRIELGIDQAQEAAE